MTNDAIIIVCPHCSGLNRIASARLGDKPVCGKCKHHLFVSQPLELFAQAAAELEPRVRLAKLNTEQEQSIAMRMKISGIPTMILFYRGKELQRQSGAMTTAGIKNWVQSVLSTVG